MSGVSLDSILNDIFPKEVKFRSELVDKLSELEAISASNHLQSTTRNLALHISSLLQNKDFSLDDLPNLVRLLTLNAFAFRARRFRHYIGECNKKQNDRTLIKLFMKRTLDSDGKTIPVEIFQKFVEQEAFGIVITAHLTFSINTVLIFCVRNFQYLIFHMIPGRLRNWNHIARISMVATNVSTVSFLTQQRNYTI